MAVPNIFATATSAIPLSQLDQNFATAITLGNTATYLGNTTTTIGNLTFTNANVASGNVTVTTVADQYGNVRTIPDVGSKTSTYLLAKSDVGRYVQIGSGGAINVTNNVFVDGDVVSVYNNTSSNANIIMTTITTAYAAGNTATRTSLNVAGQGIATILFTSNTSCVVIGNVS